MANVNCGKQPLLHLLFWQRMFFIGQNTNSHPTRPKQDTANMDTMLDRIMKSNPARLCIMVILLNVWTRCPYLHPVYTVGFSHICLFPSTYTHSLFWFDLIFVKQTTSVWVLLTFYILKPWSNLMRCAKKKASANMDHHYVWNPPGLYSRDYLMPMLPEIHYVKPYWIRLNWVDEHRPSPVERIVGLQSSCLVFSQDLSITATCSGCWR